MSSKHLAQGSFEPFRDGNNFRLYSMQYCPFAKRVRLVLKLKEIPHDIVNINISKKPDWFLIVNSNGKVPALDVRSELLVDSLSICQYLDEKYPEPPLFSKDEQRRQEDSLLIAEFGKLAGIFYNSTYLKGDKTFENCLQEITPHLDKLESELNLRGKYFGGDTPNIVDYALWPWAERGALFGLVFGKKLEDEIDYPKIYTWCKAMRTQKVVKDLEQGLTQFYDFYQQHQSKANDIDYDRY